MSYVPFISILFLSTVYFNSAGVVKYIDNLSEEEIKKVGIPNGIPLVFKFKLEGAYLHVVTLSPKMAA